MAAFEQPLNHNAPSQLDGSRMVNPPARQANAAMPTGRPSNKPLATPAQQPINRPSVPLTPPSKKTIRW